MKKGFNFSVIMVLSPALLLSSLPTLAFESRKVSHADNLKATTGLNAEASRAIPPANPPVASKRKFVESAGGHTSTLLPDGRILILGGEGQDGALGIGLIKDPKTGAAVKIDDELSYPRAWHTATMLPNGKVLILGGVGRDGGIATVAEIFNPETATFELLPENGLTPRARHTATLLSEGRVLITGGVSETGKTLNAVEIWNPDANSVQKLRLRLKSRRRGHTATLLSDGNVLIWGGLDNKNVEIAAGEIYVPEARSLKTSAEGRFIRAETLPVADLEDIPRLEFSFPQNSSVQVAVDARLALRFSKLMRVNSLTTNTVVLTSWQGTIEARIVPAEEGRLAFITPNLPLLAGTTYTLNLIGLTDKQDNLLPSASITFTTSEALVSDDSDDDEIWTPEQSDLQNNWKSGRRDSVWQSLPPLQAAEGVTAVAGQILTLNGKPLSNVTLRIGNTTAVSDSTGRFLLKSVEAGHRKLEIEGHTANRRSKVYGYFEARIKVEAGKTNPLPFTIWMPRIDTAHTVTIPSPTTTEVVVTTPLIPGLEVRIPPRSVIRDREGKPVTKLSITPIPLDRTPFPLPRDVYVPIYFTVQPGGAYIHSYSAEGPKGARIFYPNYHKEDPGTRFNFWHYDPDEKGWYIYGYGEVGKDGRHAVPDPGVAVYEFTGAMFNSGNIPAAARPPVCNTCGVDGDPVDLSTGLFLYTQTDLILPDTIPLVLTRTYRPKDSANRPFGRGTNHPYGLYLYSANQWQEVDLVLPDGATVHYVRVSAGTGFADAVMEHTASPSAFYKSRITWNGDGWDLKLKDGTVYVFGETAPLQSIRDRYGNQIKLTRNGGANGNITRLSSPNGRWIEFTYDASNRITQAKDNIGRIVGYEYDASGRLWRVTNPVGGVTEYTYDAAHKMLTIKDARGIVYLTNEYDANGRVIEQAQADSTTYEFAYTLDGNGNVTQTNVTDPRGNVRQVTFNADGYTLTDTRGCCGGLAHTFERQVGTNLLLSVTDPLGRKTAYTYDAMGNTTSITKMATTAEALTTNFTYEPVFNRLATVTDALNHTATLSYDSKGNLTSVTDPLNHQTTFDYNEAGQAISVTDTLENTTEITYDRGDAVGITSPLGHSVSSFIDAAGRQLSIKGPLGRIARAEYDSLNRPTKIINPISGETTFSYDANGNLLSLTDPRSNVTSYTYDNMDRVVTRTDPLTHQESYLYNANGDLREITDRKGQVTGYTYDTLDRLTLITYDDGSTIAYTYDDASRITQIVDSISGTSSYTYDNFDRLTNETTPQGSVSYTYDAADRLTSLTVAGQPAVSYAYDNADRLTSITQGASTVTIAYDAAGRRASLTLANGVVTQYGYDAASRLTSLTYTKSGVTLGDLTYEYDAAGRVRKVGGSYARTNLPQAVASATYNSANHQTAFASQTLSYDLNGNLTSDGTNTYTWDARDQLASISGPGLAASFQYDARGRRTSKTVNGVTTSYLYDGANVVQEKVAGTVSANIIAGGIDEVFTRTDAAGAHSPVADALGSVIALTDGAGLVQTEYSYEPFGRTTTSGAANSNAQKYTGREDDLTGLYFYRARYYSPALQRFISEDPIRLRSGGLNFYSYVNNDPTNLVDPHGLSAVAKVVTLGKKGFKVLKKVCFKDAVNALEEGEDLVAKNRKTAEEIARAAGGGKRPVHDGAHGPLEEGFRPHYHPHGRPGGHVFYGIAGTLAPFSMELSGRKNATNGQFASAVLWDVTSTLDPIGLTDAINWATGLAPEDY